MLSGFLFEVIITLCLTLEAHISQRKMQACGTNCSEQTLMNAKVSSHKLSRSLYSIASSVLSMYVFSSASFGLIPKHS